MTHHHVNTDTLEAIAFETGASIQTNEAGTSFVRLGREQFWARPSADVVDVRPFEAVWGER